MVPKTVGSPRSAQHAPRPGPRTRELHGGGRAGVSPGGKGQLRARSGPSSQLQATPALHSALEPGLCHLPPARLCPWEGRRRGQVWAPSCQPPVSLPPALLLTRGSSLVHSQHLPPVCSFSSIHRTDFFALPPLSPTGLRTPSCQAFQRAASSRWEQLPAVAASVIPGVHTSASRFFRNLVNSCPQRPLWTHGVASGPARKALANPGRRPHSPRTGLRQGNGCGAAPPAARPPPSPPR